jgi:hypothetical protein
VHQIDQAGWFLNRKPVAVTGFGATLQWADGRTVPDTVQAMVEYPGGVQLMFDCTLANSFDADYEIYYGSDAAVMIRESKAWMFKEVDSPLLGWEVYARKDQFYRETGIALVANASKSVPATDKPGEEAAATVNTMLQNSLTTFLRNAGDLITAEQSFIETFGNDDAAGLAEHLAKIPRKTAGGYLEGYQSAVTVIKANEAILSGKRIDFKPEWFELG